MSEENLMIIVMSWAFLFLFPFGLDFLYNALKNHKKGGKNNGNF